MQKKYVDQSKNQEHLKPRFFVVACTVATCDDQKIGSKLIKMHN